VKVLVTGGAGFIGSTMARRLLDHGNEVIVLDNLRRKGVVQNLNRIPEARFVLGDIRNDADLNRCGKIDAIVHCAANPGIPFSLSNPSKDFSINACGTLKVLEFARKFDCPVIYCSTNKVYPEDLINSLPLREKATRYEWSEIKGFQQTSLVGGRPHSPYGVSKLVGDLYCQEYFSVYGLPTVVNRMSCIYGTHQYGVEEQGWVAHFVFSALKNQAINIYGDGKQVRDMLWGEDLVELFEIELEKINKFKGSVWNVGGGYENSMSLLECIGFLEQKLKKKIPINFLPWRIADHKVYISDIGGLKKYWKPKTSPREGINRLIEWVKGVLE